MTGELLQREYLPNVWQRRPGAIFQHEGLMIWDAHLSHKDPTVVAEMQNRYATRIAVLPAGMTSLLQPNDVCINKVKCMQDAFSMYWSKTHRLKINYNCIFTLFDLEIVSESAQLQLLIYHWIKTAIDSRYRTAFPYQQVGLCMSSLCRCIRSFGPLDSKPQDNKTPGTKYTSILGPADVINEDFETGSQIY